jgi:hypothetical protein
VPYDNRDARRDSVLYVCTVTHEPENRGFVNSRSTGTYDPVATS